jgi:hypothetical protein
LTWEIEQERLPEHSMWDVYIYIIIYIVNLQHVSEELEVYMELLTMRCIQSFSVGHTPMLPFTGCGSGLQPRALG